jgi:ABC-type lipoprotein release transport system permease subunit
MKLRISDIVLRAVVWHRGSYITLALVAALIAAVITASLLAGHSVRQTLTANTVERLNGGAIMVSAGLRYSDRDVAAGLARETGVAVAPLMELHGRVSSFGGGAEVNGAAIWGVDSSFFIIGGTETSAISADGSAANAGTTDISGAGAGTIAGEAPARGEVILNSRLAEALKVAEGESVIIRFAAPSDLPRNTPFSPAKEESEGSLFLTVKKIVGSEQYGLFNPSISQVVPQNAFVNIDEFNQFLEGRKKANRFLFQYNENLSLETAEEALASVSVPGGQSLRVRTVPATGETEIVSDRIFIDEAVADAIVSATPGAQPVITWLANTISSSTGATPYSFVAALSGPASEMIQAPYDIVINEWLAADLAVGTGDSVTLSYYLSGSDSRLTIDSARFRVGAVMPLAGVWRDSLLMPAFPGITGSRSCTDWDTGIPLDMKLIRDKDEEYWYDYAGTPKAFIRYETGSSLWGNQFGPATAIRMGHGTWGMEEGGNRLSVIDDSVKQPAAGMEHGAWSMKHGAWGKEIGTFGFVVSDLRTDGLKAAVSGVDFSTLFLALSFFIIGSALVLLIMIMDNHLRSREGEMAAYTALGFTAKRIRNIFLGEAIVPVSLGALLGTAAGILFNLLIVKALNSVWIGAVQTDTLRAFTGLMPLFTGAVATIVVAIGVVMIRIRSFLRQAGMSVRMRSVPDGRLAGILLWPAALLMLGTLLLIMFSTADKVMLHFVAGMLLFLLLILIFRRILTPAKGTARKEKPVRGWFLSLRYYAFYPSRALTPLIFIAAGLFIVISTGANRQDFGRDAMKRTSGTGGFTHWIESPIPVDGGFSFPEAIGVMHCLKVDGDDASCLNLNHITSPHLLGVDAVLLAERGSFALASLLKGVSDFTGSSPEEFWKVLTQPAGEDAIYGFLDQTVMQWGMMLKAGDTVTVRSESGRPLHVIIAGGLKTSVFQGHLLIDRSHFTRWFPSVSGSSVILLEMPGTKVSGSHIETADHSEQLSNQSEKTSAGSPSIEPGRVPDQFATVTAPPGATVETTTSRLESFNRVTNTYLSVFVVLGSLGMILGVMGMGLNLVRNIRSRRKEFALLAASGFTPRSIRNILLRENFAILMAGAIAGTLPAILATWPSLSAGNGLPWSAIGALSLLLLLVGTVATFIAAGSLSKVNNSANVRREREIF